MENPSREADASKKAAGAGRAKPTSVGDKGRAFLSRARYPGNAVVPEA